MAKKKNNSDDSKAAPLSASRGSKKKFSGLSKEESDHLEILIREKLDGHIKRKKYDEKAVHELQGMIQEFLDCYVVIGYNFQGEPVNILSVDNQQQADSLGTSLHRLMMSLPRGPMEGGGYPGDVPGY